MWEGKRSERRVWECGGREKMKGALIRGGGKTKYLSDVMEKLDHL